MVVVVVECSILSNVEIRMKNFAPARRQLETFGNPRARNQVPSGPLNRLRSAMVSHGQVRLRAVLSDVSLCLKARCFHMGSGLALLPDALTDEPHGESRNRVGNWFRPRKANSTRHATTSPDATSITYRPRESN